MSEQFLHWWLGWHHSRVICWSSQSGCALFITSKIGWLQKDILRKVYRTNVILQSSWTNWTHTRHNTVILFFHIFLPVFYPFYCTTLSKFVYLLTHICISFFNQNWLQCDVCLRRWSNLCTYDGQFPWSGRKLCGILPAPLEQQIAHCDMI